MERALSGATFVVGYLLDEIRWGNARKIRVFWTTGTVFPMTKRQANTLGFCLSNDFWKGWMIARMPDRRDEAIVQLSNGVRGTAARHTPQNAIFWARLEIREGSKDMPSGWILGAEWWG